MGNLQKVTHLVSSRAGLASHDSSWWGVWGEDKSDLRPLGEVWGFRYPVWESRGHRCGRGLINGFSLYWAFENLIKAMTCLLQST